MFKCKCCAEKDARISALTAEIEFMRKLLLPPSQDPRINLEADKMLEGGASPVIELPAPEEAAPQMTEADLERVRILSGTY